MELHTQLIVHKDFSDQVYSILDSHSIKHNELRAFSTDSLDTLILILQNAPWESIAAVIGSFCYLGSEKIKAKARKKVVIAYPDNSRIEITGDYSVEDIQKITHPHKQLYISMFEENEHS
ncbi:MULTISPECIES: hypothetical protein [Vibrio]|uniref:hypothetical protein n=1 Tax=Vibrio TaxID=662 RepID=UPI00280FECBE|nr:MULTISPECIES: hypothetical protein [unclassified Vibrio]ELB2875392.1 hypothetical protein [Vibrio alginolyticus]MDW1582813.1 hypothetical protein [Vibrio sp. Vb2897]MDW1588178.1 hypothetical protein [Vibrio sp. Vb2910]MDW1597408.1 hypothetical protein [Vibrio sp. Vb2911]MDW1641074.1 hypothetical protein [Vibrio sp. Vb2896]